MISSYLRFKTSIAVQDYNAVKDVAHQICQCPHMHSTYTTCMRKTHMACTSFLQTVHEVAKEPPNTHKPDVNVKDLTDHDFDVWLIIELDQHLKLQPEIWASPRCSQNMIRILTEWECDMTRVWDAMKNLVCYVFFFTFLPLCESEQ